MGRPKQYDENLRLSLEAGTLARLDASRAEYETRLDVIRKAIERELTKRGHGADMVPVPKARPKA